MIFGNGVSVVSSVDLFSYGLEISAIVRDTGAF
jgi:hypothetical protein